MLIRQTMIDTLFFDSVLDTYLEGSVPHVGFHSLQLCVELSFLVRMPKIHCNHARPITSVRGCSPVPQQDRMQLSHLCSVHLWDSLVQVDS